MTKSPGLVLLLMARIASSTGFWVGWSTWASLVTSQVSVVLPSGWNRYTLRPFCSRIRRIFLPLGGSLVK